MRIKKGFYYSRICLPLWFALMAVWTIFSPTIGIKILEAYTKIEKEKVDAKIDNLHK